MKLREDNKKTDLEHKTKGTQPWNKKDTLSTCTKTTAERTADKLARKNDPTRIFDEEADEEDRCGEV